MLTDIAIAQRAALAPLSHLLAKAGLGEEYFEPIGRRKAKLDPAWIAQCGRPDGKLILVTAMTPTPLGEGKTTTTIGLADALNRLGHKTVVALREPSLGPVFGVKGGAAGGGWAQVVPMEDINLHFTGDFHAITAANNLLAALIDNHIYQGNTLGLDPRRVTWRRCMDMNDRQLRAFVCGLGGTAGGMPREDGFDITAASEVMAAFCLAGDMEDLKERLGRMVAGYTFAGAPVTARDLDAQGAMAALLKDAFWPNIVQTLEKNLAVVHGGPFANIAHGCNSVVATRAALKLGDYAVTEAGFGADLGAEKFFDIKCRQANLKPDAVVLVATLRALKLHGGAKKSAIAAPDAKALAAGLPNLLRHAENIRQVFGLPCAVAINRFPEDTEEEIALLTRLLSERGIAACLSECWEKGGAGALELAREVVRLTEEPNDFSYAYPLDWPIAKKLDSLVRRVYGGAGLEWTAEAKKQLKRLNEGGYGGLPVCVAKTQYSFSDDPKKLGAPEGFTVTVRSLRLSAGAGFVVALTGEIMTMPGLPKSPAAERIDVDGAGRISGLF